MLLHCKYISIEPQILIIILLIRKRIIEAEMDTTYEWRENPEKKSSTIVERIDDIDFEDKEHWTTIFDLIITRILRMREVLLSIQSSSRHSLCESL